MTNPFLEHGQEPDGTEFVYIQLPVALEPDDREARFGDPLDAELRMRGIGYVSGGGQLMTAPDENGESEIIYCGVDVDTLDVTTAREMLRVELPELGCPEGTLIQYGDVQDRYENGHWQLGEPIPFVEDR